MIVEEPDAIESILAENDQISNLPAGIYIASVKGEHGSQTSCKFVIR